MSNPTLKTQNSKRIPRGYKQTEVGVIPEEWEADGLGRFWSVTDCKHVTAQFVSQGFPLASIREVQSKFVDLTNAKQTTAHFYNLLIEGGRKPSPGDLILSRNATVGEVAQVTACHPPFAMGQDVCLLRKKSADLSTEFLQAVFQSPVILKQLANLMVGSTFKRANVEQIRNFSVPMPSPPEQRAIAEALSDVDSLLGALDRLIAKKRDLKQAAMQKLFQPTERWLPTCLAEIADPNKRWSFTGGPFGSNLKSSDYTDIGVRIIQLQNIGDGTFRNESEVYTTRRKADELVSCCIYPGEIILSKMGDPVARACIIPSYHDRYLMCSDGIRLAVDQKRFNTFFVYTLINAPEFRMKAANAGTGSTRKRIGLTTLKKLEMYCPPHPEQTAIAAVLSDMDAELSALEQRREKTRALKQAMMQELLTGRIRLL